MNLGRMIGDYAVNLPVVGSVAHSLQDRARRRHRRGPYRRGAAAAAPKSLATTLLQALPGREPAVPTVAEAGLPGFLFGTWFGLVAPTGTPAPLVQRISAAVDDALRDPEVGGRFTEQGAVLAGGSPENFAQFLDAERTRLEPLIRGAGIRAD
jgi:tripartite-type tricarboxylate transporter receptor subunit TctC